MATDGIATGPFIGDCCVLYIVCAVSAAAGVGGGGIIVPILTVVFGIAYKTSTVLSSCTLIGNYFSQILVNSTKSHPLDAERPLIYWDLVLILLPCQLGGSNIGTVLNTILPDSALYITALFVLAFASIVATRKGIISWKKESDKLMKSHTSDSAIRSADTGVVPPFRQSLEIEEKLNVDKLNDVFIDGPPAQETKQSKSVVWPWPTIATTLAAWLIYVVLVVAMVTFSNCAGGHIGLFVAIYPVLLTASAYGVHKAAQRQKSHPEEVLDGDFNFADFNIVAPLSVFTVGIICSLLGIGGSELTSPLFLTLGVLPQVSAGTVSMLSFLNTVAVVIQKSLLGEVDYDVAAILCLVGLLGGSSGRYFGIWFADVTGRASALIFILVLVLACTCIYYVEELATGSNTFDIKSYCT